jgi:hypothetical protein
MLRGSMLSKCANPGCSASFRYLREGRVFNVERRCSEATPGQSPYQVEFFWLCKECSQTLRIVTRNGAFCILPVEQESPKRTSRDTKEQASSVVLIDASTP